MGLVLIDTNLLIRFFTRDDLVKAKKVKDLFTSSKNNVLLLDMVVAECIWLLKSYYELDPEQIESMLVPIIESPNVVANKQVLRLALDVWIREKISFIDAYEIAMSAELGVDVIYSYDKKLAKVSEIKVSEP